MCRNWFRNTIPKIACESSQCNVNLYISSISGNPMYECKHLKSVNHISMNKDEISLPDETLESIVEEKRMNQDTNKICLAKKK